MEEKSRDFLAGRIKDLAQRAYNNNFVTHTDFLSLSEISEFYRILASEKVPQTVNRYMGATYCIYGGTADPERAVICFLPEYLDEETFKMTEEQEGSIVSCILVEPLNARFSDDLNHRDYLGALMNLGIERDKVGDILTGDKKAYVFVKADMAETICKDLVRIRHTSVKCRVVKCSECDITPEFAEVRGSVASERCDAIISFVYHLSRNEAQKLIEAEQVFIDGRTAYSGGYDLKAGARVSVRGHGKFVYLGPEGETRKGRLFVVVKKYV